MIGSAGACRYAGGTGLRIDLVPDGREVVGAGTRGVGVGAASGASYP